MLRWSTGSGAAVVWSTLNCLMEVVEILQAVAMKSSAIGGNAQIAVRLAPCCAESLQSCGLSWTEDLSERSKHPQLTWWCGRVLVGLVRMATPWKLLSSTRWRDDQHSVIKSATVAVDLCNPDILFPTCQPGTKFFLYSLGLVDLVPTAVSTPVRRKRPTITDVPTRAEHVEPGK